MGLIRERHLVRLAREVDVFIARELASDLAARRGFDAYHRSDIETAVSELCTNAIKYGERGWASLRLDDDGFDAVITDEGPGFGSAPSSRSGLRVGLAGAGRLMDTIAIERLPSGSRVRVTKRLPSPGPTGAEWSVDAVSRLRVGNSVSGDRFLVCAAEDALLVAVVDGLGSGEGAAVAATAVIESLLEQALQGPLDEALENAHRVAAVTRGAVGLVVRVDPRRGLVEYAGVGDVAGMIEPAAERLSLRPGVLGLDNPRIETVRTSWSPGSRLVLWTDGIDYPGANFEGRGDLPTGEWAEKIALRHGTERDDGLILLAEQNRTLRAGAAR